MTKVFFVRHAQPDFSHADDRTRPLTAEGEADSKIVVEILKDKKIDLFYCSPYKRSVSTIQEAANYYGMEIQTDERFREREKGKESNTHELIRKRWENRDFHEEGGESINIVQARNVEALKELLDVHNGKNIVIGTHGTALSTILNYYLPDFGCDDFFRIIDWMPYIVEMDFEGQEFVGIIEHGYVEKEFKAEVR